MINYDFDHSWFMAMNFDGGDFFDAVMTAISGVKMWIPLYMLILFLVYRRSGFLVALLFLLAVGVGMGLSDLLAGIFKHTGPLKHLWADFPPRWRPMYEPALEGLQVVPDTLKHWRHVLSPEISDPLVHVPEGALGGSYGTVSAHAATITALTLLSISEIRQRWFTILMIICAVLICYSRIYLAKHYPVDIALGVGLGLVCGGSALWLMRRVCALIRR